MVVVLVLLLAMVGSVLAFLSRVGSKLGGDVALRTREGRDDEDDPLAEQLRSDPFMYYRVATLENLFLRQYLHNRSK